ncbi:hypothetical protein BH10BAC2_BH10BAC2_27000 [soil metagenome]
MGNNNDGKTKDNTQAEVAVINAHAQVDSAKIAAEMEIRVADKNFDAQVISGHLQNESAKINANAQIKVAQIANDPLTLDANEAAAYELIKKTGILTDLSAFEVKLASGDKEAKADAIKLEATLKKDGKELTVDGKITDKTIAAAQGLVGENSDAIIKYEEVMNKLQAKKPTPAGAKVQSTEIEF